MTGAAVLVSFLAASAASAATFTVNRTDDAFDDSPGNGRCDVNETLAGRQCSLRAAVAESNDEPNRDRIEFASDPFIGEGPESTVLLSGFLNLEEEVTIEGGNCGPAGAPEPCAGIDVATGNVGLAVSADDVTVRHLAVHGGGTMGTPIRVFSGADRFRLQGSWINLNVSGAESASSSGVVLHADEAVIGGKLASERNLFGASSQVSLSITIGDRNRVLGNRFGVGPSGLATTISPGTHLIVSGDTPVSGPSDPAVDNTIGAAVSKRASRTPECDGGCNVIANAGALGISLQLDGEPAARGTSIKGNFIGIGPNGTTAMENGGTAVNLRQARGTTLGGNARARNVIVGGTVAFNEQPGAKGLTVRGNFIGLNSEGTGLLDPPIGSSNAASSVYSDPEDPTIVDRNRFGVRTGSTALVVAGERARVTRNTFGLDRDGEALAPIANTRAIGVIGGRSVIGAPGMGNRIALEGAPGQGLLYLSTSADSGDRNRVQGNRIGLDAAGGAVPNDGIGIGLQGGVDGNLIGGTSPGAENVISNTAESAIVVSALGQSPTGNRILRNRGRDNGADPIDVFVDLRGSFGFGNGTPAVHGGIEAPAIDSATRTRARGSGAEPGAEVYLFRTAAPAGASPNRIDAFVARATADGAGDWSARFDRLPANRRLAALQVDAGDGSSELSLAVSD